MRNRYPAILTCIILLVTSLVPFARAEEGMWLFSTPPTAALKQKYGFDLQPAWLEHLMKSSIRFGGASGSFVSADGLAITNHHVGRSALQKLSSPEHNYPRDGFFAKTAADELMVPGMELNVLQSMEEVTARVNAAIPKGTDEG